MNTDPSQAADADRRFGGLDRLYGRAGAAAIRSSHVVVIGLGGVGSWAAEALARSGVARLTLIDLDHVAESNVNRQIHATNDTLGQAKVQAMRERIASIHPACRIDAIEDFVSPENWPSWAVEAADAVIDACDQVKAKVAVAAWAQAQYGVPPEIVAGIIGGFVGATVARKLNKNHIRYSVIAVGLVVAATYFVRVYG